MGDSIMSSVSSMLEPLGLALTQAHEFWYSLPTLPLLIGHCVMASTMAPEAKNHFLLHFWLTFLAGFAGGPLSALLIMNPAKAPISLMASNKAGIVWTACWWLMTYSPIAPLLNAVYNFKPVKVFCKSSVSFMRATFLVSRVQLAAQLYPGVLLAPILAATVAACGGKSTHDVIRYIYGIATGPAEFTVPGYSFRSAFLGSVMFFFGSMYPLTRFLSVEQAAAVIITLFVGHTLFTEITGVAWDWSASLMAVLLRIANIPWPSGVPRPSPAALKPAAPTSKPAAAPATQPLIATPAAKATPPVAAPANSKVAAVKQRGTPSSNGSLISVSASGLDDTALPNGDLGNPGHVPIGGRVSLAGGVGDYDDQDFSAALQEAAATGKPVDADVIRAALQRSAKTAAGKNKAVGKGKGGDGWQVVEGKKKVELKKTK